MFLAVEKKEEFVFFEKVMYVLFGEVFHILCVKCFYIVASYLKKTTNATCHTNVLLE